MKRYQVYLNQNSVSVLDDFEKISSISRSKVIRQAIDRLAEQLVRVVDDQRSQNKEYILDTLNGFVDLKINKKTNFAQEVDEIYFSD
ncbi:hypothetical protein A3I48_04175 [Candidatus Daviesbacteria bacterium RIFCSPLOWO2_02_FULL_36_7]|uniref:Ribbon-helix-helix protein CopG domain-containing protein n=1 Tax=Candidatus Daviesbacteria bacterium RIFCSPLOWO2_02_FULL_36_7 TaxID=1797792 RepID=A0A1F5MHS5_9BACT|nr:MAG: hypothetical protein A3I48_04175 [Candidatus Daviesbacteria bacterium RIFCSPLOWO2_02_FULL_36_7]